MYHARPTTQVRISALVWQLMRAYTLDMLSNLPQCGANGKVVEGEIIKVSRNSKN